MLLLRPYDTRALKHASCQHMVHLSLLRQLGIGLHGAPELLHPPHRLLIRERRAYLKHRPRRPRPLVTLLRICKCLLVSGRYTYSSKSKLNIKQPISRYRSDGWSGCGGGGWHLLQARWRQSGARDRRCQLPYPSCPPHSRRLPAATAVRLGVAPSVGLPPTLDDANLSARAWLGWRLCAAPAPLPACLHTSAYVSIRQMALVCCPSSSTCVFVSGPNEAAIEPQ
jgi:hypothetical protein